MAIEPDVLGPLGQLQSGFRGISGFRALGGGVGEGGLLHVLVGRLRGRKHREQIEHLRGPLRTGHQPARADYLRRPARGGLKQRVLRVEAQFDFNVLVLPPSLVESAGEQLVVDEQAADVQRLDERLGDRREQQRLHAWFGGLTLRRPAARVAGADLVPELGHLLPLPNQLAGGRQLDMHRRQLFHLLGRRAGETRDLVKVQPLPGLVEDLVHLGLGVGGRGLEPVQAAPLHRGAGFTEFFLIDLHYFLP